MSSGCLNTYKNSIIAEGSRVRLLPPITPTRNSMIAEGFRVWLLPARTPTRNPLDFEGFRVEEMSGKWTADFQHSRLALPHTIDPRTGSVPGQNKRENGRTNKPNPNTKRLPLFNVGDLNGTRGIENQKPHRVWVCFCSFFVFPFILSRDGFHPLEH